MNRHRNLSLDQRLFFYWDGLPIGTGVTMGEMVDAMGVIDPQHIRNALVRIRKGEVGDPTSNGRLVLRPIRYDSLTRRYYDLSKATPDLVRRQVPGHIVAQQVGQLLTRALTLMNSLGEHGLALSAQEYLSHDEIRDLLTQLPIDKMWQAENAIRELSRARQIIAIRDSKAQPSLFGSDESTNQTQEED